MCIVWHRAEPCPSPVSSSPTTSDPKAQSSAPFVQSPLDLPGEQEERGRVAPHAALDVDHLELDGHGYGHGVGLSQYGARGAAIAVAELEPIGEAGADPGTHASQG